MSIDADLRSGRRLETGRRSESIIYIMFILQPLSITTKVLSLILVCCNVYSALYVICLFTFLCFLFINCENLFEKITNYIQQFLL
jgi:hypothetical protein